MADELGVSETTDSSLVAPKLTDAPLHEEEMLGQDAFEPAAAAAMHGDLSGSADSPLATSFIYAVGRIEPEYPSLAVEKELAQVAGRSDTVGLTDTDVLRTVLADRENRYLARQLAWVLTVESLETYLLLPRDPADVDVLIEALRSPPRRDDVDVVVGVRGPLASPEMARGLVVPIVYFDQIYSFDTESLVRAIPRPDEVRDETFRSSSLELFERMRQIADNAGGTNEHRALNYLAVCYPRIYADAAEALARNETLSSVDVRRSRLGGETRTIVDVVFNYTDRATDVTTSNFVRVDVTEEFPFLVTKLSPYFYR
ncbi:hypothetical protein ABZ646_05460 [Streptomyces sp. NPDC007162]|uniref:cyanobactin maturation protease PatG family protein n=1 Tax=Streptomyces sp. NPDC007162 TaxID=3156917 RepID=UPI003400396D